MIGLGGCSSFVASYSVRHSLVQLYFFDFLLLLRLFPLLQSGLASWDRL